MILGSRFASCSEAILLQCFEKSTVVMYSTNSIATHVNEALFYHGNRTLDMIPPTHNKHCSSISCELFIKSSFGCRLLCDSRMYLIPQIGVGSKMRVWSPFWTSLPDASKYFHCSFLKACRGHCRCSKASLYCTLLCRCQGGCYNTLSLWSSSK